MFEKIKAAIKKFDQGRIDRYHKFALETMNQTILPNEQFVDFTVAKDSGAIGKRPWFVKLNPAMGLATSLGEPEYCIFILTNMRIIVAPIDYVGIAVGQPFFCLRQNVHILESRKVNFALDLFIYKLKFQEEGGEVVDLKLVAGNYKQASEKILAELGMASISV